MLKTAISRQYSKYGTFDSDASISFLRGEASHIYKFCGQSAKLLHAVYPETLNISFEADIDVAIKRKLATRISRELREFSPYFSNDINIVYDNEDGFLIVLRDPENIGYSFIDRFVGKSRSYVDAQLHIVATFLLDKKANQQSNPTVSTTGFNII